MNNKEFVNQFGLERNLSQRSIDAYLSSVNKYTDFHQMDMHQLIQEADEEEEQGIRLKRRTIKNRLVDYRQSLIDEGLSKRTVKTRFMHIKSIYVHYEIEIPLLPKLSGKQLKTFKPIMFNDLPSKSIIRQAIYYAEPLMKAIILLESSSGMGRTETLNLTVADFIRACGLNITTHTLERNLNTLFESEELIVPTFTLERQKTKKYYYTFCTPEAVQSILYYLTTRKNLTYDDKLFKIGKDHYYNKFQELNDVLQLGKLDNGTSVLRGHMLRKFHASHLRMGEHPLLIEEIDALQGRRKSTVHEAYFLDDPSNLKQRYIDNMNELLIYHNSTVIERRQIEIDRSYEQIERMNKLQEERMKLLSKLVIENPEDVLF